MPNAKENGESGCFNAAVRNLLCCHGASNHLGSDFITLTAPCPEGEAKLGGGRDELGSTSSSGRRAGVVARLMGLETLPDANWVPGLKSPDLFMRSRSANFMDYLLEANLSSQRARRHPHRRVRTSVSFREAPVEVPSSGPEPKEKNFIVVIMENRDEPSRTEMKMREKSRNNEVQRKKKKKKKASGRWRDERRTRSRADCNSESRRPNNVRADYEKKCGDMHGNMRPISIGDQLQHRPQGSSICLHSTAVQAARTKKKAAMKKEEEEVIELAGAEAGKSLWFSSCSSDCENICAMIGGHVLDCLLEEFILV